MNAKGSREQYRFPRHAVVGANDVASGGSALGNAVVRRRRSPRRSTRLPAAVPRMAGYKFPYCIKVIGVSSTVVTNLVPPEPVA